MSTACPVCAEPLARRPERCFRCETQLSAWWRFDEALAGLTPQSPAVSPARGFPAIRLVLFAAAAVIAMLTVALVLPGRRGPTPEAAQRIAAPSPLATLLAPSPSRADADAPASPRPSRAPVLRYRVQRGDSLWRIAAALTGNGRRWRELWPERGSRPVIAGEWLEVPTSTLAAAPAPLIP